MNSARLLVRIAPLVLALLLGALASSGHPVSSQPQEEGQLQWWAVAEPHANGMPLAATGPGHVEGWGIRRCPSLASGYPCIWPVPDKILFTEDYAGGLGIIVSGAEVHDKWTWSHYYPPEGGDLDWACWMQIRNPGEPGNPTQHPALVTNCTPYGLAYLEFSHDCPCSLTAAMFDGGLPIAANEISAQVTSPVGEPANVSLHDDGVPPDATAGDHVYSGTFQSTQECGVYGVTVNAVATSSEGTVNRQQLASFYSQIPGDDTRDPCSADDDEDGLTDSDESSVIGTDPLDEDTDDDGLWDGAELQESTDPLDPDTDDDTFLDGSDNCPLVSNSGQEDVDLDTYGDVCEADADADGFLNTRETYHGSDWLDTNCSNATNDDAGDDTKVNDGCPPRSTAESGGQCDDALDNDGDGKVNDGCPQVGTRPEASLIEVCDGLDNDADTQVDEGYPDTNPGGPKDCMDALVDTDGDTVMNTSDANDDDDGNPDPDFNDGVLDTVEVWAGTDTLDACRDDSNDDAWAPDMNNNGTVNILDVMFFPPAMGSIYGGAQLLDRNYNRRLDLNADKTINILDVMSMTPHMGKVCAN